MLSDFDLIGTIDDSAEVPEDEESGSDDEVSKYYLGSDSFIVDIVKLPVSQLAALQVL